MAQVTWHAFDFDPSQPPAPPPRRDTLQARVLRHVVLLGLVFISVLGGLFVFGLLVPIGLKEHGIDTRISDFGAGAWFHLPFAPIDTIYDYVTSETPMIGQAGPDFGNNIQIALMCFISNAIAWSVLIYLAILVWHVFVRRKERAPSTTTCTNV